MNELLHRGNHVQLLDLFQRSIAGLFFHCKDLAWEIAANVSCHHMVVLDSDAVHAVLDVEHAVVYLTHQVLGLSESITEPLW